MLDNNQKKIFILTSKLTYQQNNFDKDVLVLHYPLEIVDEQDQPHK
jgi:hypothetical protein